MPLARRTRYLKATDDALFKRPGAGVEHLPGKPHKSDGSSDVKRLLDAGCLTVEEDRFEHPDREVVSWLNDHRRVIRGGSDASTHHRLKLIGASYLDQMGHEMETRPTREPTGDSPSFHYTEDCFEVATGEGFQADVCCTCEDCKTVVEVGNTPGSRLVEAYGLLFLDDHASSPHDDGEGIARCQDNHVDEFCIIPYGEGGNEWKPIYRFQPGSSLPEPDQSYLAGVIADAFIAEERRNSTLSDDEIPDSYK